MKPRVESELQPAVMDFRGTEKYESDVTYVMIPK